MVEVTRDLNEIPDDAEGEADVALVIGDLGQGVGPVLREFWADLDQLEHGATGQLCAVVNVDKNLFRNVLGIRGRIVGLQNYLCVANSKEHLRNNVCQPS